MAKDLVEVIVTEPVQTLFLLLRSNILFYSLEIILLIFTLGYVLYRSYGPFKNSNLDHRSAYEVGVKRAAVCFGLLKMMIFIIVVWAFVLSIQDLEGRTVEDIKNLQAVGLLMVTLRLVTFATNFIQFARYFTKSCCMNEDRLNILDTLETMKMPYHQFIWPATGKGDLCILC